jgi:hypothetical protein
MSEVRSFVGDPCSAYRPFVPQGHTGLRAFIVMPTFCSKSSIMVASYHEAMSGVNLILHQGNLRGAPYTIGARF